MNLYQKLIEVRKAVPYLQKDAENKFHRFTYVSSSKCLAALKAKMDELDLLLVPTILEQRVSNHKNQKGNHEYFTELVIEYCWYDAANPDDHLICKWYGQGLDAGEKGVGKAVTYSEKYFLLKFFNIPTDNLDPDAFEAQQGKVPNSKPEPPREPPNPFATDQLTDAQHKKIEAGLKEAGIPRTEAKAYLKIDSMTDITKDRASRIINEWDDFVVRVKKERGLK